jgi:drug/metabolite transporter (DMT)-like permease
VLWAVFTVIAAGSQTLRNAMQKELTTTLGTVGATHVRFLFGLPFAILFLTMIVLVSGVRPPPITMTAFAWTLLGALTQIGATALLLAAMRERSFVVTIALSKTEPVHVALLGLIFLGDRLTAGMTVAIALATVGVVMMSWPKKTADTQMSWQSAALGIASGAMFGFAAIGFRGGIKALDADWFVIAASTILVLGLVIQTLTLTVYLLIRDREKLAAIFRAWRPSIIAGFMGAFASQMWFLAFALESAAKVRTLALVELLFAQLVTRQMFKQKLASREAVGIALMIIGVIVLLNT